MLSLHAPNKDSKLLYGHALGLRPFVMKGERLVWTLGYTHKCVSFVELLSFPRALVIDFYMQ
jgi:hypothetical protein